MNKLLFAFTFSVMARIAVATQIKLPGHLVVKRTRQQSEVRSWRISRIGLCGGDAVHGFVVETQDGKLHGSLLTNDMLPLVLNHNSLRRRGCRWISVHQPDDYIVRVSGYHLQPEAPSYLCHSLRITLRSGNYIQHMGDSPEQKGEAFSWDVLESNNQLKDSNVNSCGHFYANQLEFDRGSCSAILGIRTIDPLQYSMNEDHRAVHLSRTSSSRFVGIERPSLVKTSDMLISRVCICGGAAVHGVIFEYYNGTRSGDLLANDPGVSLALTDKNIAQRGGRWVPVRQPGGHIISLDGTQLPSTASSYLCHSLSLTFGSGQVISFLSNYNSWRGDDFRIEVPTSSLLVHRLFFDGGKCVGLEGFRTLNHIDEPQSVRDTSSSVPTLLFQSTHRKGRKRAAGLLRKISRLVVPESRRRNPLDVSREPTLALEAEKLDMKVHQKQLLRLHKAIENWLKLTTDNTIPTREKPAIQSLYALCKMAGIDIDEIGDDEEDQVSVLQNLLNSLNRRAKAIDNRDASAEDINDIAPLPRTLRVNKLDEAQANLDETVNEAIVHLANVIDTDIARTWDKTNPSGDVFGEKVGLVLFVNYILFKLLFGGDL